MKKILLMGSVIAISIPAITVVSCTSGPSLLEQSRRKRVSALENLVGLPSNFKSGFIKELKTAKTIEGINIIWDRAFTYWQQHPKGVSSITGMYHPPVPTSSVHHGCEGGANGFVKTC